MHSGLLPRLDVHPQPGIAPYLAEVPRPYTPTPPVDIPPPNTLPPPMSILPPNTLAPSMSLPPPSTLPPLMGLPPPNTLPLPIGIGYSQPYPGNLPPSVPSGGLPAPPPPPVGDFLSPPPLPPGGLLAPPPLPPDGRPAPPPLPPDGLPAPPPLPPGGLHIPFPMVRTPPVGTPYFPSSVVTLPPAGVPLLPAGVPLLPVGMPLQPLLEARPLPPTPPTLHRHPEQIAVRPPRSPVANDSSTPASASTATPAPGVRKEPVYEQEEERSLKKIYEVDPLAALERQEPVEQPAKKKVKRQDPYACQGILNVKAKDAAGKVTVYSSADMPVAEKDKKKTLPPGWEERMSKSKKKPYFVNAKTGEATWGRPIVVKKTLQKGPASSSVKTSKSIWNKWQTTSQALRREEEEDD